MMQEDMISNSLIHRVKSTPTDMYEAVPYQNHEVSQSLEGGESKQEEGPV